MITLELLNQIDGLKDLPDNVKSLIVDTSKIDEDRTIGPRIGQIHGQYQNDIETALGIKKPEGWKSKSGTSHTYEWLKEAVLPELKSKADQSELKAELERERREKESLQKQISEGKGNEVMKKQLDESTTKIKDLESTIDKLRNDATTTTAEWESKLKAEAEKNASFRINANVAQGLAKVNYKKGIPQKAIDATIDLANKKVSDMGTPEFVEKDGGGYDVVIRGKDGLLIPNPKNLQKPFTYTELVISELGDIIDPGKNQKGTETGATGGTENVVLDLSGINTKPQAQNAIRDYLSRSGIRVGTKEFADKELELYASNGVEDLPMK